MDLIRLTIHELLDLLRAGKVSAVEVTRAYLDRIEGTCGVTIDLISTGPDREETIVRRHPFQ